MEKLRSSSGASLILALLFFLLCTMVGASVLAAEASNVGKISSNRRMQQEYFTVSSALQLVCDNITASSVKYEANAHIKVSKIKKEKADPLPTDPSTANNKFLAI